MLSGVTFRDIVVGSGSLAERGRVVMAHFRGYRSQGQEMFSSYTQGHPHRVRLGKRDLIIGLERGIEGMRVGGHRELEISAHLAGGLVPPDEFLRVEVELLDVREAGEMRPEDYPPGKFLTIVHPGEAARRLSRWQFNLAEHGGGSILFTHPRPGVTWRHAASESAQVQLNPQEAKVVFESALATPQDFPQECLSPDEIWGDSSEQAHNISRDRRTNTLCLGVDISERGASLCRFSIREDSVALLGSEFYHIVSRFVEPHMRKEQARQFNKPPAGQFRWSD